MNVNRRLTAVVAWLLMIGALASGCAMSSVGYNMLPTWAMWQLDSWVNLDEDQRTRARAHVDALHRWHRTQQLPQYASFLRAVDDKVRHGLDEGDLAQWRGQVLAAWQPVAHEAAPGTAELLMSLKPEQVERLRGKIADANRKWVRENMGSDEKALSARVKRYVERAEFFFGDLTREQTQALRAEVVRLPANQSVTLAERESRQQRLLALIERLHRERPSPEVARRWSEEYLLSLWDGSDRARRVSLDQSARAGDALSVSVWAGTSEAQRRHLSRKLRDFADQATVLAAAR